MMKKFKIIVYFLFVLSLVSCSKSNTLPIENGMDIKDVEKIIDSKEYLVFYNYVFIKNQKYNILIKFDENKKEVTKYYEYKEKSNIDKKIFRNFQVNKTTLEEVFEKVGMPFRAYEPSLDYYYFNDKYLNVGYSLYFQENEGDLVIDKIICQWGI